MILERRKGSPDHVWPNPNLRLKVAGCQICSALNAKPLTWGLLIRLLEWMPPWPGRLQKGRIHQRRKLGNRQNVSELVLRTSLGPRMLQTLQLITSSYLRTSDSSSTTRIRRDRGTLTRSSPTRWLLILVSVPPVRRVEILILTSEQVNRWLRIVWWRIGRSRHLINMPNPSTPWSPTLPPGVPNPRCLIEMLES